MGNQQKQLRFFKILVTVLVVIVLAQFTFWLKVYNRPSNSDNHIQKVKSLSAQPSVLAPAVSGVIEFLKEVHSVK